MTAKPKIIIIGPGYPYRNGQSIYLNALCNRLSGEFKIEWINFTILYPKFLFPGSSQFDKNQDKSRLFPNKRMINSMNPFSWLKTAIYIKKQKPDLIAIDWWHPFFGICNRVLTACLPKKERKKVIFITENVISHEANLLDRLLTKIGLKNAQCFLALSESVEKQLHELFNKKVFRSALPIYGFYKSKNKLSQAAAKAKFGYKDEDTVFLFFGLVRKYKGLDLLIEAFANLFTKQKNIRLLVAGDFYEDPDSYFDLIKKLNLGDVVHMENRYIPNDEVEQYFLASDAVVLPYRSATQSGVLSIAYGLKRPVIVTRVGELGNLVKDGETGLVVDHPNVEYLNKAMADFLTLKEGQIPFEKHITQYLSEVDEFKNVPMVFQEMLDYLYAKQKPEERNNPASGLKN